MDQPGNQRTMPRITGQAGRQLIPALLAAGIVLGIGAARSQPPDRVIEIDDLRSLERAFVQLADRVRPSTVSIRTYNLTRLVVRGRDTAEERRVRMARSHGSGAVIRHNGYILTSAHVIDGADEIVVILHDGRELEARLVQADQRSDLAVVKVDTAGLRPVNLRGLSQVRQGQWSFVVGNPFGLSNSRGRTAMTYGIISALEQDLTAELNEDVPDADQRYYGNLIQTSAAINPGNSGGPLFSLDGEMIGVVTAIESRSGVTEGCGFAIPMSPRNRGIVDQLREGQTVQYGYLGVTFTTRDTVRPGHQRGVRIAGLLPPDGPAGQAGLQPDDVILEIDRVPIKSKDHLIRAIGATRPGSRAQVAFLRDGQRHTVAVTMAERPVSPVMLGSGEQDQGLRTCYWRGAWLQEPPADMLLRQGLDPDRAGLAVVIVEPGSDADKAGLEPAQMVLTINRKRVRTIEEFLAADQKAGPQVRLQVHTEDGPKTVRMPKQDRSL